MVKNECLLSNVHLVSRLFEIAESSIYVERFWNHRGHKEISRKELKGNSKNLELAQKFMPFLKQ